MDADPPVDDVIAFRSDDLAYYPLLRLLNEDHLAMVDRFYIYNPKLYDSRKKRNIVRILFWTKEDRVYAVDIDCSSASEPKLERDPYEVAEFEGKGIVSVANGAGFLLALTSDGTLLAWGGLYFAELGTGRNRGPEPRPVRIAAKVRTVRCVDFNIGAIDTEDNLWMWGQNEYGILATSMFDYRMVPTKLSEAPLKGKKFADFVIHSNTTMALTTEGEVFVWGKLKPEVPTRVECGFKVYGIAMLDEKLFLLNEAGEVIHKQSFHRSEKLYVPEPVKRMVSSLSLVLLVGTSGKVYVWRHCQPVVSSTVAPLGDLCALYGQLQSPGIIKLSKGALSTLDATFQNPTNSTYQLMCTDNMVLYTTRATLRLHSLALRFKLDAEEDTTKHTQSLAYVSYPALLHYIRYLPLKTPNPNNEYIFDAHIEKLLPEIAEIPIQFIELAFEMQDKVLYLEAVHAFMGTLRQLYEKDKSKVPLYLDPLLNLMDARKTYLSFPWHDDPPMTFQEQIFRHIMKRIVFLPLYLKRCTWNIFSNGLMGSNTAKLVPEVN